MACLGCHCKTKPPPPIMDDDTDESVGAKCRATLFVGIAAVQTGFAMDSMCDECKVDLEIVTGIVGSEQWRRIMSAAKERS